MVLDLEGQGLDVVFDAFIFEALIYMALTFILVFAFRKLENHLLRHQRPVGS